MSASLPDGQAATRPPQDRTLESDPGHRPIWIAPAFCRSVANCTHICTASSWSTAAAGWNPGAIWTAHGYFAIGPVPAVGSWTAGWTVQ
eukprot:6126271-Pyramimonas_sp.AAC.1